MKYNVNRIRPAIKDVLAALKVYKDKLPSGEIKSECLKTWNHKICKSTNKVATMKFIISFCYSLEATPFS
jgi:hypothetical protein